LAAIDFDYSVDVEATDKQGGGGILPHMYARIWAEAIDFPATTDGKGRQAALTFEVQEPEEFKGRKFWSHWTMLHADEFKHGAYKYGKPMFDRFCRAVQVLVEKGTDSDDLLFKSFVVEIGIQPGNGTNPKTGQPYKDKNQIERFYYEDDQAKEPVPELGVIGDGTMPASAPKASNDNKPAAQPAAAPAAAKKTPWGAKKAA
jgi:hypothetical protein